MSVINPFDLLGLNENHANIAEARAAYYSLALDTHPDRSSGNSDQFRIVHSAWRFVSEQLKGVPDAGEVIGKFEAHKAEWEAFLAAQIDEPLPSARDISDEDRVAHGQATTDESDVNDWGTSSVAPAFRDAWAAAAGRGAGDVAWTVFPRGGYGKDIADAPASPGADANPDIFDFPPRELVVYEAPEPAPDRFSSMMPGPMGFEDEMEDFSANEANPLGTDLKIALSDPPKFPEEDPRIGRTEHDVMHERDDGLNE